MKRSLNILLCTTVLITSCKKYLEVGPPKVQLSSQTVFSSNATATAAQLAVYAQLERSMLYNQTLFTGLAADEFRNHSSGTAQIDLANNNLTPDNSMVLTHWNEYYKLIYQENAILEGLANSIAVTEPVRRQLEGEARMIRAYCHFYLANIFGDVPIARSTDYSVNAVLSRSLLADVYQFVREELVASIGLLDPDYKNVSNQVTTERTRPNQFAARALLARVYLFQAAWTSAEALATDVISNTAQYSLVIDLNTVFLKNSREAIWQTQPVVPGFNTYAAGQLIFSGTPFSVSLSSSLLNAFADNDNRRNAWVKAVTGSAGTFYHPNKYKVAQGAATITEYSMVLRLAEQYLIRAEARARQDNLNGAETDLNLIRQRAGLLPLNGLAKPALLDSIQQERKLELFTESGDRWFNLKRTGQATAVLGPLKGSGWQPTDTLFPVPLAEIQKNLQLVQNAGY